MKTGRETLANSEQVLESQSLIVELGDFLACFASLSGETHILNAYPAEAVRYVMESGSVSVMDLFAYFEELLESPLDDDFYDSVINPLLELGVLRLRNP